MAKIFAVAASQRYPVKTIKNYLEHLNLSSDALFQKPRDDQSQKFSPADDKIWYCNSPVGSSTLDNMLKKMSRRAGLEHHLTNHCLKATAVTALSDHNCETRHIKSVTGHRLDQAVESYNDRLSIESRRRCHTFPVILSQPEPLKLPHALVSLQLRKKTNAMASKNGNLKVKGQF